MTTINSTITYQELIPFSPCKVIMHISIMGLPFLIHYFHITCVAFNIAVVINNCWTTYFLAPLKKRKKHVALTDLHFFLLYILFSPSSSSRSTLTLCFIPKNNHTVQLLVKLFKQYKLNWVQDFCHNFIMWLVANNLIF